MKYVQYTWEDGEILNSSDMNKIEQALAQLSKYEVPYLSDVYVPSNISTEGLNNFETLDDIYNAYDNLVQQFPKLIKRCPDLGLDASSQYEIRHYVLGGLNLEIINSANSIYEYNESEFPKKRILLSGNIHGYNEKFCCYGCFLLVKEIIESNENWALFLKRNIIIDIIPQPNPYGFANKTNTNKNNKNLNRTFFNDIQPENSCIINLIQQLKPKGLIGAIDFHNTFDGSSCLICGKNTYSKWEYYGILTSQLEILLHDLFEQAEKKNKDFYVRGWNNLGSKGQFHEYLDTENLLGISLEMGYHLGITSSIFSKIVAANILLSFANFREN